MVSAQLKSELPVCDLHVELVTPRDRGHGWAAGGLSVDKNARASSTLKPRIFEYFMTPSSPAPFIRFALWLVAAFHE